MKESSMKTAERNVVRLAVVQHLRSAFGIKTKNWNKCKSSKSTAGSAVRKRASLCSTPAGHHWEPVWFCFV